MNYKSKYLKHFGYGEQEWVECEICQNTAVWVHHIIFKSQGGKDNIENLIALCDLCHTHAHSHKERWSPEFYQEKHDEFLRLHSLY